MSDPEFGLRRRQFLTATGAVGLAGLAGVSSAQPGRTGDTKGDELLIGLAATAEDLHATIDRLVPVEVDVTHTNETLHYAAVTFPSTSLDEAKALLQSLVVASNPIKYVEENALHEAFSTPNDPYFDDQYAPQEVNADDAWDTTQGDPSVTIGIVDTGAQYDHADLAGNYAPNPGYDFVDDDGNPAPDAPNDEYHGTHVSGIAGAVTDNGTGVAGISDSALINGRALDESGRGNTSDIADAIEWATDQGANVINLSLGGGGYTSTMKNAVSYADGNGVLVVAAAGNDGSQGVSYPAAYSECIAVSALDPDGSFSSYSQYGEKVELCAPGSNVLSTTTDARGSYEYLSGTSMATPVVAGVAGLTLAQWDLTNDELRAHLKDTAVDVGLSEQKQGSGRVDAANAVSTDPSGGSGDGGNESTSTTYSDSLWLLNGSDCHTYAWSYSSPSQVVVELDGPSGADFDLYVNDGVAACPSSSDADYAATTPDSQEKVVIDAPDDSTDLYVTVDSYSGSGSYDLTITEYQ